MITEIKVPSVGESITEGVLSRWFKKNGELVKVNEPLFEVETEKATTEVVAPQTGVLSTLVKEGDKVNIGAVVGSVDGSKVPAESAPAEKVAVVASEKNEEKKKKNFLLRNSFLRRSKNFRLN